MADAIRHARAISPWFIPNKGGDARDLHGITDITVSSTQDSEDVFVVGKQDKCGTDKGIPEVTVSVTQNERGEIGSYLTLANLDAEPAEGIDLNDFSSALVDVVLYQRDQFDGNIIATTWIPKTAISSLNLDIADPEAIIERSFDLVGDNKHELEFENKVLIHLENTNAATTGTYVIDVTAFGIPELDPNNSGEFILRVDRTRTTGGITETETMDFTTNYTYNSGNEQISNLLSLPGDIFNVYYSTEEFPSGQDPTTVDTADPCFLKANSVTVLISDGTTEVELDVLTSLSIAAAINRIDEGVIGSAEKVLREISDTPVDLSLSGRIKDSTILRAFMNTLDDTDHSITDINLFHDNVRVVVKIYSDSTKSTFLIGYRINDLSFTDDNMTITANEFGTLDVGSSATNLLITTTEANLS